MREQPAFIFAFFRMTVTVAIDCMGGDHGPDVTVRAALDFVRKHEDVRAILVGVEERIRPLLGGEDLSRLIIRHASEVVAMAASPLGTSRHCRPPSSVASRSSSV